MTEVPGSQQYIEFLKSIFTISPLVLIPTVLLFALWVTAHVKISQRAGYPPILGIVASVFPPMYLAFAFSRWPIEEKILHLSGARHKNNDAPISPNRSKKR